jgi:DNA-binding Xre family transcriptional regulator
MTKLKELLIKKSLSQKELFTLIEQKCNVPIGYDRISKIVNGKITNYSLFTLLKFCVALNCSPNDLVDREEFMQDECK